MVWKKILVPHDFSSSANHAAALARDVAKLHGATILLLHVVDVPPQLGHEAVVIPADTGSPIALKDYAIGSGQAHLDDLAIRLGKDGVEAQGFLRVGSPVDEIVRFASEEPVDLIVIGTHGRTGLKHLLLGSVAERVVRHSGVPVLTVRHPEHK
jgi:nucleotide-binding universal stress UspA family protein